MHVLQLLFKTSAAALLLGLCLTLRTGTAQGQIQNVISANLTTSQIDNSTGYVITLAVSNLISQCIVVSEEFEVMVKNTLEVSDTVFFPYGNFRFTSCLCGVSTRRFFWEIEAPARQKVISITLTVERTGNSDDYNEILGVTSHVPVYLVDPCATLTVQLLNSSTASERAFGQSQPRTFAEQNVISITLRVERVGNSDDYIVTLTVTSHAPVYLVVKATLEGSDDVNFPYGNFVYTACLCPNCSKNFFWDIQGPANGILIGKAEVVSEENICPSDVEISTPVYKVCSKREIVVTL
ncbi:hypothetical protein MJG53_006697 [Ovis ammon polii x Ovis aries]|uniref:Uncharacterized protein n=1 Tax=Ovis ammon polii x Ovis aries TaxID=2918886 RepID=A0ACB9V5Y9_9CETA|nr:hypothetical protein MJG53_006697 [Ovis ammon polii x Ovis aries]